MTSGSGGLGAPFDLRLPLVAMVERINLVVFQGRLARGVAHEGSLAKPAVPVERLEQLDLVDSALHPAAQRGARRARGAPGVAPFVAGAHGLQGAGARGTLGG